MLYAPGLRRFLKLLLLKPIGANMTLSLVAIMHLHEVSSHLFELLQNLQHYQPTTFASNTKVCCGPHYLVSSLIYPFIHFIFTPLPSPRLHLMPCTSHTHMSCRSIANCHPLPATPHKSLTQPCSRYLGARATLAGCSSTSCRRPPSTGSAAALQSSS